MRPELPTPHELRAALAAAAVLGPGLTVEAARAAYRLRPGDGVLRCADLVAGERLLLRAGLLRADGDGLRSTPALAWLRDESAAQMLLCSRCLRAAPPSWLLHGDDPPPPDAAILAELFPDAGQREALLHGAGQGRADARARLGARGEKHVAAVCRDELHRLGRPDLAGRVVRVSTVSDLPGYDVLAPAPGGPPRHLEVKTTTRPAPHAFLSRHEAEVGRRDARWSLVFCRATADGAVSVLGWCPAAALADLLPHDAPGPTRWASVELTLPPDRLRPGIPPGACGGA